MTNHYPPSKAARVSRACAIRELFNLDASERQELFGKVSVPAIYDAKGLASSFKPCQKNASVSLTTNDSVQQALLLAESGIHPTILIFGSARRAGGGWDKGAKAQEEDVALHSTWGLQAEQAAPYYSIGKAATATAMNPDLLLWAERGLILASDLDTWLSVPLPCSFIAFAAPNANGLNEQGVEVNHPSVQAQIKHHLEVRCIATLVLAMQQNVQHLVLGAIGCGVFGLNPEMVAQTWRRALAATGYDGDITFALPSGASSIIGIAFSEVLGVGFSPNEPRLDFDTAPR